MLIIFGNTAKEAYDKLANDEERWTYIGQDPEHVWAEIGKPFTLTANIPKEIGGRLIQDWANKDYLSVVWAINVVSTGQNVSTANFATALIKFHALGPPNVL